MSDHYKKMEEQAELTGKERRLIAKHLEKYSEKKGPLETRGILDKALFGWMNPLFKVSLKDPIFFAIVLND